MRGRIGVLVSALVAALVLPAAAYGSGWSSPQRVAPGYGFPLSADTNANGDSVVAYAAYDDGTSDDLVYKITVAYRKAGGPLQTHTLGASGGGEGFTVDVAMDNAGRMIVAWPVFEFFTSGVRFATYNPANDKWKAYDVPTIGAFDNHYSPSVAVSPGGKTVLAFGSSDGTDSVIRAQTADTPLGITDTGSFIALSLLSGATDTADLPQAAAGADGTLGVVWQQRDTFSGNTDGPAGSLLAPGVTANGPGGWTPARYAGATDQVGGDTEDVNATILPDGTLLTSYLRPGVGGGTVYVNTRPKPTAVVGDPPWIGAGTPVDGGCGFTSDLIGVGTDAAANVTIAYGCYNGSVTVLKTASAPAGGAFAAGTPVKPPTTQDQFFSQLDVAPDGTAVLSWSEEVNVGPVTAWAAVRAPGAAFGNVKQLAEGYSGPVVAHTGGLARAFTDTEVVPVDPNDGTDAVDEFVFDSGAPVVTVTAPATTVAIAPTHLKAAATDLGSTPGPITWDFGDGTTATGADVDHTFGAPGTYTVKASATDGSGNTGTGTAKVVVQRSGPPDSTPPGVKVVSKSAKVSDGTATIKVSCPKDEFACVGSLTVKLGKKAGARTVKFTIAGGATAKVTVKLSKAVLVALQNAKSVKVAVTATAKDAAGNTGTGKRNVVLKG